MSLSIEDIAIKDIISVDINSSLEDAIKLMAKKNHRNIVVIDYSTTPNTFYFLDITDLLKIKIENKNENISLKNLELLKAKLLKKRDKCS